MGKKLVMVGGSTKIRGPRSEKLETRSRYLRERGWKIYQFALRRNFIKKIPIIGKILLAFIILLKSLRIFRKNPNCIILTMNHPPQTHLVGLFAKRIKRKIKWVAEFRDAMLEASAFHRRDFIRRITEKVMEPQVVSAADKIVIDKGYEPTKEYFQKRYSEEAGKKIEKIPYVGFDGEKFEKVNPQGKFDRFTITYTGNFYKGWINPEPFLQGLQKVVQEKNISPKNLMVRFYTNTWNEDYKEVLESLDLEKYVEIKGFVPYGQMVSILKKSHLLLYINGSSKTKHHMIHGKFYDYIGSGTPILALAEEGFKVREIIKKYHLGICASDQDINDIFDALKKVYSKYFGKNTNEDRNEEILKKEFSRKKHDREMEEILTNLQRK